MIALLFLLIMVAGSISIIADGVKKSHAKKKRAAQRESNKSHSS
jgi:hypothetical protein